MRHLNEIAALLFSEDPRLKAEKILGYLVAESGARGGALLALSDAKLLPFVTRGVDLDSLAAIRRLWEHAAPTLERDRPWSTQGRLLAPVMEAGRLVGVLYLEAPAAFDAEDSAILRSLLGRALALPAVAPEGLTAHLDAAPAADLERQRLWAMLQRHQWNIAEVARNLGVTRRTIYMRMKRYGVPRRKVPKTLKNPVPA